MHERCPIAVVVPMRNAAPWLPVLLAALVREWATGFELIAVDDGSTDGTGALLQQLCSDWPAHRWRLIRTDGVGVSAARNLGVAHAAAPLIAFLDADDRPMPGRLELSLEALQVHPELSHVHGGWWRCNNSGELRHQVQPWLEGAGFDWRCFIEHKAVLPSAWTVRRDVVEAVGGFDPTLHHAEDVDLLLRLAAKGYHGAWIPQPLVRYRVHASSASARLAPQLDGLLQVLDRHLEPHRQSEPGWTAQLRYDTTTWASWRAWSAGDPVLALSLLDQALRACPYPQPRRPVHYLEVFARSCARIGETLQLASLLNSLFWQQAEERLLA